MILQNLSPTHRWQFYEMFKERLTQAYWKGEIDAYEHARLLFNLRMELSES